MRNRTYGGVRGRKTKVGRKLLRFPPARLYGRIQVVIIKDDIICIVWCNHVTSVGDICNIPVLKVL